MAISPLTMNNATLKFGTTGYAIAVDSATFTPSHTTTEYRPISGDVLTLVTGTSWKLDLRFAQDWSAASAESFSQYLRDNHGDTVAVEFTPQGGGKKFTSNVTILEGAIGGASNAIASASVSLPCTAPVDVVA